jgi:hypothetical protein
VTRQVTRLLLYRRYASWHAQVVSGRRAGRWLSRVGGVWRWMPRMPMGPLRCVGEFDIRQFDNGTVAGWMELYESDIAEVAAQ